MPRPALELFVAANPAEAAQRALQELQGQLRREPEGLISFATGRTYESFYADLRRWLAIEPAVADRIRGTHLDEFVGLAPEAPQGMSGELFARCEPLRRAWHEGRFFPVPGVDDAATLAAHETALADAGGVALQFLGLGRNGHLAFNEPGAPLNLGFHVATLAESTRADLAPRFSPAPVPVHAATAGLASIRSARRIILVATGASKAPAVARLFSGEVSLDLPTSCLHAHDHVLVIVDAEAGLSLPARGW